MRSPASFEPDTKHHGVVHHPPSTAVSKMARFSNGVRLKQCGERPKPIHWTGLYAQVEEIQAVQLDDNSILLAPLAYLDDPDDSLEADWRNEYDATRCWKTTVIYEQIDENHPHLVP
jgi:hypothetical protein